MIDKQTDMSAAERMGEEIATLAARIDAATYELLVLIRKFDELGNWGCGFLSCAHFLNWRIGLAPGAARERVRIARALGDLPRISAAMKRGELFYSKVRALTRVARPDTEETLLGAARTCTAAHVEQIVGAWRRIDRSVEAADDELRDASSEVTTHVDENGMVVIRGRLAPEAGELLRKALKAAGETLYSPEQKDRPSAGKVRADALVLVAESALRGGLDPGSSGDRYQVVVHVNEEELGTAASGSTNGRPRADLLAGDEAKALRNQAARPATAPNRHGHVPAGTPGKDVPAGTPARPVAPEVTEANALENQAARPATATGSPWARSSGNAGQGRSRGNAGETGRFGGDRNASKRNYEDGMARAFGRFHDALRDDGRLVIVFANKQPDAWETLVSALIRAGFVACGSWPIQTEMKNRQRSLASAALSSSIWLVCRRRRAAARPGWDAAVLAEMRSNITDSLRRFWDAGIRGPDFVWAATGPALEAFSRHPIVKKADAPRETLSVAEFLRQVRRIVVTFVVNRLLEAEPGAPTELDDLTTYYLSHRNDFGLDAAPAGPCILYAVSCNLSDADLAGGLDLLARGASAAATEASDEDGDDEGPAPTTSGSQARLKPWNRRRNRGLGEPSADGEPPPLIDCVHRLMQLWKTGEQGRVDRYLADRGLWRHELFARLVQAVIELAAEGSEERSVLESIQNHLQGSGAAASAPSQRSML